jgi:hypothetical protein
MQNWIMQWKLTKSVNILVADAARIIQRSLYYPH